MQNMHLLHYKIYRLLELYEEIKLNFIFAYKVSSTFTSSNSLVESIQDFKMKHLTDTACTLA